eukprot:CAMPEP_0198314978 /NCGR_PEP_ID=MMETSP1450-20131203/5414_1 /TAXON_ID=753684 ORGANISM="Madagascaria erythrocladiodes, Strain CCMP3234" /NCGR_SAMPLE_ID=MMETSP1450 /ASSEMBLY_ACC=CAM_ASM_001115 /LENGTH=57 /DNA_ID=CAMNT_0044018063 /DNA_START=162 /DNA_END=335 /DNA_ORIENTATION=+
MIVVDLSRLVWFQKCYDVDCRGFRGNEGIVPAHVDPFASQAFSPDAELLGALADLGC